MLSYYDTQKEFSLHHFPNTCCLLHSHELIACFILLASHNFSCTGAELIELGLLNCIYFMSVTQSYTYWSKPLGPVTAV
jgi:hypothetical protein